MFLRIATLTLAQALDLTTFAFMVLVHGPAAEANPLVASVYRGTGLGSVVALKVALIVLVASLGILAAAQIGGRRRGLVGGLPMALAIAVGLVGGITNAATILH